MGMNRRDFLDKRGGGFVDGRCLKLMAAPEGAGLAPVPALSMRRRLGLRTLRMPIWICRFALSHFARVANSVVLDGPDQRVHRYLGVARDGSASSI